MIEIVIGAVIGAVVSLIIAEIYHRRASKETSRELDNLSALNVEISETLEHAVSIIGASAESTELVKRHVVAGTLDDPEFPYK